jgi:hemoglobin
MMSAHAPIAIDAITAEQWIGAMSAAMRDVAVDQPIAEQMETAFQAMASAMIRR